MIGYQIKRPVRLISSTLTSRRTNFLMFSFPNKHFYTSIKCCITNNTNFVNSQWIYYGIYCFFKFHQTSLSNKKKLKVQYNITKFQFVNILILSKHNIHAYFYTISHLLIPYRLLIQKLG